MPLDKSHQMDFLGLELVASEFTGVFNGTVNLTEVEAIVNLTDSLGGGAADSTVAAVPAATAATTDTSAASLTSVNAAITVIAADLKDLTAKLNALLTALKA